MKRGISHSESIKHGMREGKSNSEARKLKKYNQKSGESASIDLAPMVDIAFLLLTFFIMTTSFSKPKVFGMGLPQESSGGRGGPSQKSQVITLKVSKEGVVFMGKGEDKPDVNVEKVDFSKIKETFGNIVKSLSKDEKVTLVVKLSSKVKFGMVIDILDEVYRGGVTEWATLTLKPEEEKFIEEKVLAKG